MSIISTSLTVPGQPSPRFHVEAWLFFSNMTIALVFINMASNKKGDFLPYSFQFHFCLSTVHL